MTTAGMPTQPSATERLAHETAVRGQQWLLRADTAFDRGDYAQAETCYAEVLALRPDDGDALRQRALSLQHLNRGPEAVALLRQAVATDPDDALTHNCLGTVLAQIGDSQGALDALRRACELEPGLAAAWFNLGRTLRMLGRSRQAIEPLQHAVRLDPMLESARFGLAECRLFDGDTAGSAREYREILQRFPLSGLAWWGLANLKSVRLDREDVARLQHLAERSELRAEELLAAHFALGKALEDVGDYAPAFEAYRAANAFGRQLMPWNADGFERWLDHAQARFDTPLAQPLDSQFGKQVIFIVGLPRSGSTLVEQILGAHADVEGAGELPDLGALIGEESRRRGAAFPDWIDAMSAQDWHSLGQRYLDRTARWRVNSRVSTDKMPGNWLLIDAVRAMLPGARIIDCRRDALETCWSCLRQIFWHAHEYSYATDDVARYWAAHDRALRIWQKRYSSHLREQVHESLLAEPEREIRELLDFCGLPFDPACLRPHEATRSVATASAAQVREPIRQRTTHVERYGALLDPLREALRRAGSSDTR